MMKTNPFAGYTNFDHQRQLKIGVLIANLGTPDAPTAKALRPYLDQFLSDQRVIEINKFFWQLLLKVVILNTRPARSAANYAKIWTKEGSPLLVITRDQTKLIREKLEQRFPERFVVEFGMRYGNPSVESALEKLRGAGINRLVVLPMYAQYSSTTTGATFDVVSDTLKKWRWIPDFRFISTYHDRPEYIAALAASIREVWDRDKRRPEKLLYSFHGIPQRYFDNGDPYFCLCHKTARLTSEALGLSKDQYIVCFQSIFGREEWIKPTTAPTVEGLAKNGLKSLDIVAPGFSADCLETLEELDGENREIFEHNGGEKFRYIPCLNARPDNIAMLTGLIEENIGDWLRHEYQPPSEKLVANTSK
jgi:ferrochelatase